jgi:signal transduction histidine kinase
MCNNYSKICIERYKYLANLEYKHRLVGKISKCLIHDISTPLSVLSGSLKLLENSKLNNKEISNIKKVAVNSLLYLESILDNSFLLLKDSKCTRKFSANYTVKKVLLLLKSRIKKSGIVINCDFTDSIKIYGNESLFARAVLNVLINSIEELEMNKKEKKIIDIKSKQRRKMYILRIKDNGRGIERKVLASIRRSEFSMKDEWHLGLGLSFVFDTVKNHFKGSLEIKSVRGKSTTVIFKIPI